MNILSLIVFGLIVGIVAKFLMPGRDGGGIILTIILGIAGSFVGSYLGSVLGLYRYGNGAGWVMSIVGAIILLAAYRLIFAGQRANSN